MSLTQQGATLKECKAPLGMLVDVLQRLQGKVIKKGKEKKIHKGKKLFLKILLKNKNPPPPWSAKPQSNRKWGEMGK